MNRRGFFGRLVGGAAALCGAGVPPAPEKRTLSSRYLVEHIGANLYLTHCDSLGGYILPADATELARKIMEGHA